MLRPGINHARKIVREIPRREALIDEYEEVCRDLQVEVVELLVLLEERHFQQS